MSEVKPFQIWDVRENEKAPWREAKVASVRRDAVELQFLDMPNAPLSAQIFNASCKRMLSDRTRYRLVREAQPNRTAFSTNAHGFPKGGAR